MPTRNPRVTESFVQVFLNGQLVGTFGPYQTMRAALADAKTLAISRRDNRDANGGIDVMVHTHKTLSGQDAAYEVVARKKGVDLPAAFIAQAVAGPRGVAQSGRDYTQQAQKERVVRFNGKKKPARKRNVKALPDEPPRPRAPRERYAAAGEEPSVKARKNRRANPQVEFTAHGKPVSFFARKTKGK